MADIRTFEVDVTQTIRVTLDASKLDKAFADEFNRYFYDFGDPDDPLDDMLGKHAEHVAQLQAREIWENSGFIEGYGKVEDFGIKAETIDTDIVIVKRKPGEAR